MTTTIVVVETFDGDVLPVLDVAMFEIMDGTLALLDEQERAIALFSPATWSRVQVLDSLSRVVEVEVTR